MALIKVTPILTDEDGDPIVNVYDTKRGKFVTLTLIAGHLNEYVEDPYFFDEFEELENARVPESVATTKPYQKIITELVEYASTHAEYYATAQAVQNLNKFLEDSSNPLKPDELDMLRKALVSGSDG